MEEKISYDTENDILFVNMGEKAEHAVQMDNFVVDFSFSDKVVGMEILDAAKTLSEFTGEKLSQEELENARDADIRVKEGRDAVYVSLFFVVEKGGESVRHRVSINLPAATISPGPSPV